ncbi:MAG TPA: hypothetical protein DC061_10210 [Gemmobacter sp.]|nr:hypothetical protein [Gemmobacter sp.]
MADQMAATAQISPAKIAVFAASAGPGSRTRPKTSALGFSRVVTKMRRPVTCAAAPGAGSRHIFIASQNTHIPAASVIAGFRAGTAPMAICPASASGRGISR